jgi:glycosyl transferase family 25
MLLGYYINLDERVDRREHFETSIKGVPFFSSIERMSAVKNSDGSIGCGLSHIKALLMAKQNYPDESYVAIFEDDFCLLDSEAYSRFVMDFSNICESDEWDCIVLTPRGKTLVTDNNMTQCGFKHIIESQTTTGYIIKMTVVDALIENLKEAVGQLLRGGDKNMYSIDQYWKKLQTTYRFYYYQDIFAGQLPGWSNVEKRMTNYNERFIKQPLF